MSGDDVKVLAQSLLPSVKLRLGLDDTNTVNDSIIVEYICDIIHELDSIGVPANVINSSSSLGAISKGVKDVWNYNGGTSSELSQDFYNKADRLRRKHV